MITKEQIVKQSDEILHDLHELYTQLERLWSAANVRDAAAITRECDRLQHLGKVSVGSIRSKVEFLTDDIYEVLEENEKVKDLPKLLDLQMAFDQIQATVKRWDERLYPEG